MRRLCSIREYCSGDIRTKVSAALGKGDVPPDGREAQCAEILESLVADGYLDDRRYATAFARDKSSLQGWGPKKIGCALRMKGIDAEIINFALGSIDEGAARGRLERLVAAKSRMLGDDPRRREKLIAHLTARGYNYKDYKDLI